MSGLRFWLRRRRLGWRACRVPTCSGRRSDRGLGISAWCDAHTDAIFAGGPLDKDGTIRRRLGARRWLLKAELDAELERAHALVLEGILAMPERERSYSWNRACWDTGAIKLSARVDELLELNRADS